MFLDLETTGVDVARDRICELAATHAPADHQLPGGSFSSIVWVDPMILKERGGEAAAVHCISDQEIALAPKFVEAWARFLQWTEDLLNGSVQDDNPDTSEDEPRAPQLEEAPVLLLAAHNGVRALHSDRMTTGGGTRIGLYRGYASLRFVLISRYCFVSCIVTAFPVGLSNGGFL